MPGLATTLVFCGGSLITDLLERSARRVARASALTYIASASWPAVSGERSAAATR